MKRQLVLLHGWMSQPSCWEPLLAQLGDCDTTCLALPGHTSGSDSAGSASSMGFHNMPQLISSLAAQIPEQAILVGWSLGGSIGQWICSHYPEKISHLVCVCSSLKFIASDDWQYGMSASQFTEFSQAFDLDATDCARKFIALQSLGDSHSTALRKQLLAHLPDLQATAAIDELRTGLQVLGESDTRQAIQAYSNPISFIAGENDHITSPASMEASSQRVKDGRFYCMEGSAHAPMLAHSQSFAKLLAKLVEDIC